MSDVTLEDIVKEAEDKFGSKVVQLLNEKAGQKIPVFRTGIPQLDIALGVGGLPKGRIVEISGPESSGKTTTALQVIAQAQRENPNTWTWIGDMEHAIDPSWATRLGVNLDKVMISQPDDGNQCLDLAQHFATRGLIDILLIDSVASLVPKAELEGEAGDSHMGLQARMMSQAMRRLVAPVSQNKCLAIFINQIREKIGVVYGSPETTPGGRGLKFAASIRIDVRKGEPIAGKDEKTGKTSEKKENAIGSVTKYKVVKNKCAPPFKIAESDLIYKTGFDFGYNMFDVGVRYGVIAKSGTTYTYENLTAKGKLSFIKELNKLEPDKKLELYKKAVDAAINLTASTSDEAGEESEEKEVAE